MLLPTPDESWTVPVPDYTELAKRTLTSTIRRSQLPRALFEI
jgi:hypothetical protein